MSKQASPEIEIKYIAVEKLKSGPEQVGYQRPLRPRKVKAAGDYDPSTCETITVSFRAGQHWVVNGQMRVFLARRDRPGHKIPCRVLRGLTYAQEARLYRRMGGTTSAITVLDDLVAAIEEGTPAALEIASGLADNGFKLGINKGRVRAAKALLVAQSKGVLGPVLRSAKAWADAFNSVDAYSAAGLACLVAFFAQHANVDEDTFKRKLCRAKPIVVIGEVKTIYKNKRGSKFDDVAAENLALLYAAPARRI